VLRLRCSIDVARCSGVCWNRAMCTCHVWADTSIAPSLQPLSDIGNDPGLSPGSEAGSGDVTAFSDRAQRSLGEPCVLCGSRATSAAGTVQISGGRRCAPPMLSVSPRPRCGAPLPPPSVSSDTATAAAAHWVSPSLQLRRRCRLWRGGPPSPRVAEVG